MKEKVQMERSESGNYIYVWYTDRDALYRALKAWYDAMHQLPEHAESLKKKEEKRSARTS